MTMDLNLQQACDWIRTAQPQARLVGDPAVQCSRVHTDTRSLQRGDLFVALRGDRFDAQAFLPQAQAQGAAAALAQGGLEAAGVPGIEVADPLAALGTLAAAWRAQYDLPLIAVTGSNGKTTVTQMIAAILAVHAPAASLATQGNFNNAIGLPLTLLRLNADHRCAVVELGMNHPGEIAELAAMAQPTVALVNNAQREHLEFMHNVEAVARENGSVLTALTSQGTAVFPAGDSFTALWQELAGARRCITFGTHVGDVQCESAHWEGAAWQLRCRTPDGLVDFSLGLPGEHNVRNALASMACAVAAGASLAAMAEGLSGFRAVAGRSRVQHLVVVGRTVTLVDDTYNANPDSMRAAIDVLAMLPSPRLLVIGDMGEVGTEGPRFHAEAGAYAHACGVNQLFAIGSAAAHAASVFPGSRYFESMSELQSAARTSLGDVASVLVKGSRFMRMERVVGALQDAADPQAVDGSAAADTRRPRSEGVVPC